LVFVIVCNLMEGSFAAILDRFGRLPSCGPSVARRVSLPELGGYFKVYPR
jgi:hypothetical protein